MTDNEIRTAWQIWQKENPEEALQIRSTFADKVIFGGICSANRFLAREIAERIGIATAQVLGFLNTLK